MSCSLAVLDDLFKVASGRLGRIPCIRHHLRRLATKLCEKGGLALLCLALCTSGCYSTRFFDLGELVKLDGFHGGEVTLTDENGKEVLFTEKTLLYLVLNDGDSSHGEFSSIRIEGEVFYGETVDGRAIEVDLNDVKTIIVREYAPWKTVGLVGAGIVFVTVGVLTVMVIVVILNPPGGAGGNRGSGSGK